MTVHHCLYWLRHFKCIAVKVAAGADYSVVLTDDGYVYSFGNNTRGQLGTADVNGSQHPTPVLMRGVGGNGTLGGVVDIAAGAAHTMLLLGNKTMWIVGDNTEKQLGVDTTKDGNTYTATIVEVDLPADANSSTGDKVEAAALSAGLITQHL